MLADEITEMLFKLEGIQESAFGSFLQSGDQEQEKDPVMVKIDLLLSGSSFVSLEIEEGQEEPADRKWIEKQGEAFCGRLDGTLKALSKPVMRAVMAKILSALPNVFTNARELEDYIKNSLESCTITSWICWFISAVSPFPAITPVILDANSSIDIVTGSASRNRRSMRFSTYS